jgi:hypothetical protein
MGDVIEGEKQRIEHVLIDYENVQPDDLALLQCGSFRVKVFVGPRQPTIRKDVVLAIQKFGGDFVDVPTIGKDAVDFHIAYYLGTIATTEPNAWLHVISKDTGFDPLIQHLQGNGRYARRSECIGEIPSVKAAEKQKRKKLLYDAVMFLDGIEVEKRPATLEALQNSLGAYFKQLDEHQVEILIQGLKSQRFLAESEGRIQYLQNVCTSEKE